MREHIAVEVKEISKVYKLYNEPVDRLKEAFSLSKKTYFNEYYALDKVSFEIEKGEILGIVGNNGSGKSTVLKMIAGVLTPTSGNIEVDGKISALLELGAGFNGEYTGIENIYLNGTMQGKSKEEIDKEIPGILDFAEIGDFINQPVKTYSSGMFARLAFSVAINIKPEILIVDEILAVGDQNFQIKCMKKMKQMMKSGTTVLYVAHDINSIKRFCTKVLWLNKGSIMEYGDVDRVTDKYLDFLKNSEVIDETKSEEISNIPQYEQRLDIIAEIQNLRLLDDKDNDVDEFSPNQKIRVEVTYDVYDTTVDNPVIGIAIRSIDDDYVCGLNTLLDGYTIKWEKGRNSIVLEYTHGILSIGGQYYIDVAVFDETATVPIQYKAKEKSFTILSKYKAEGRYIIPHKWED